MSYETGVVRMERPHVGWPRQLVALAAFLLLCYGAAWLGQIATTPNIPTWYAGLAKPGFSPPNAVFPIVWGILYTAMAVAAWLVWREPDAGRTQALAAFAVQLALNVAWSWAFFGARSPGLGLVVIVLVFLAIAVTTLLFLPVNRFAALLMLPYLAWVGFATVLNLAIFWLN